jgi:hypothetical protein
MLEPTCVIMAQFGGAAGKKIKILGSDLVGFTRIRLDLPGLGRTWSDMDSIGFDLGSFWSILAG